MALAMMATARILAAKMKALCTSTIGKTVKKIARSETARPTAEMVRSHNGLSNPGGVTENRDGEHDHVGDPVEKSRGAIDELEGFLRVRADQTEERKEQSDSADEENRVSRRSKTFVQPAEPGSGSKSIPSGNHG